MMINVKKTPLLIRFEEKIEEPKPVDGVVYNQKKMLLTKNDIPLALVDKYHSLGITRHTRVSQETHDDD